MRIAIRVALAAAVAGWTICAIAADPAAESPQVQIKIMLAEFDETDRTEIERVLGDSKDGNELDENVIDSLEKLKLLRVVISPKIKMPGGSTASIEHECGTGLDQQGETKPATLEIEVSTRVETAFEQLIVTSIRCLETIGKGESRRSCESFIGGKLRPGESRGLLQYDLLGEFKDIQTSSNVHKLLFVKATIVKPKSIEDLPPAPRFESQAPNAEKEDR